MVFHTFFVSAFTGKPQHFLTTFSPIKQEIKKINNKKAGSGSNSLFQVHLFQLKFLRISLPDPSIEAPDADDDNGARTPTGVWVCELVRQQSSMGLEKTREVGSVRGLWSLVRGSAGEEVRSAWFVDRLVGLVVYEKE